MEFLIAKDQADLERVLSVEDTPVGKGVFAKQYFEVGDTIALLTGKLIEDSHYDSRYCIEMSEETSLEPDPPFRFINHCCEPNCWLISHVEDDDDPLLEEQLALYVRTSIYPGEEITIDYAWPAESAIECLCQSVHCRGWIVDVDELNKLIEMKRKQNWVMVEAPLSPGNPNPEIIRTPRQ